MILAHNLDSTCNRSSAYIAISDDSGPLKRRDHRRQLYSVQRRRIGEVLLDPPLLTRSFNHSLGVTNLELALFDQSRDGMGLDAV